MVLIRRWYCALGGAQFAGAVAAQAIAGVAGQFFLPFVKQVIGYVFNAADTRRYFCRCLFAVVKFGFQFIVGFFQVAAIKLDDGAVIGAVYTPVVFTNCKLLVCLPAAV